MTRIEKAQKTCDGLHRLIKQMNGAVVDLDKGGESAHELLALLASTSDCISHLSYQLHSINHLPKESNVSALAPKASSKIEFFDGAEVSEKNIAASG